MLIDNKQCVEMWRLLGSDDDTQISLSARVLAHAQIAFVHVNI